MSKKTIYINIGLNKTGSTTLEHTCVNSIKWLNKHNLDYFSKVLFYQHFWGLYFDSSITTYQLPYLHNLFNYICDTQLPKDNVILIDEDLTLRNPFFKGRLIRYQTTFGDYHSNFKTIIKNLKYITQDHQLKIIVYIRRQDLFLESLYCQNIKTRHYFSSTFNTFKDIYSPIVLDWLELATTIENIIGKENLIIKCFDANHLKDNDITSDFFSILNCPKPTKTLKSSQKNLRIDAKHFETIRAFRKEKLTIPPEQYLKSVPSKYCTTGKPYGFLDIKQRQEFLDTFKQSNQHVSAKYFNNKPLFSSPNKTLPIINQTSLPQLSKQKIAQLTTETYPNITI